MSGVEKHTSGGTGVPRNRQIARIWCLARDLGMDSAMLHVAVESVTGINSIANLNFRQLVAVIRALEIERKKQKRRRSYERSRRAASGVAYLPTADQREKVSQLLDQLAPLIGLRDRTAYLNAICRKSYRKDYTRLGLRDMQALIETLKSIVARARKPRTGGGDASYHG